MTKKEDYRLERYITIARVSGKSLLRALAVPILVIAAIGLANADDDNDDAYAIGLWGDLPYSAEQAAGVSALIADMNWRRLAFTVHDGDLKAGGTRCDDVIYTNALGYFRRRPILGAEPYTRQDLHLAGLHPEPAQPRP